MTTIRTDLQKRAEGAILQYAIFRWESAAVIAVTILLFFFLFSWVTATVPRS